MEVGGDVDAFKPNDALAFITEAKGLIVNHAEGVVALLIGCFAVNFQRTAVPRDAFAVGGGIGASEVAAKDEGEFGALVGVYLVAFDVTTCAISVRPDAQNGALDMDDASVRG